MKNKPKLIFTVGLPGSTKSTFARRFQAVIGSDRVKIVDKDSIRELLDQSVWSKSNEKFVLKVRDFIIEEALSDGYSVVVHDTNLAESHQNRFKEIAEKFGAELIKEDFTHVTIEECIANDLKRNRSVGEAVIRKMHKQFLAKNLPAKDDEPQYIKHIPELPYVVCSDIDGTLALMGNRRSPYDFSKVHLDTINEPVRQALFSALKSGLADEIVFCSGRSDICREATEKWLENAGFKNPKVLMRAQGDYRKDNIIKRELIENNIIGKMNVVYWLDDRQTVTDEIRSMGIPVFQVAPGNF